MQRSRLSYLLITLKGIAMGVVDVIPGVSGGTIAFITGIYEELISSIKDFPMALPLLFKRDGGCRAFWIKANLNFLVALVTGIAISFLSLAGVMTWLLENHQIVTWSFFFGLILASVWNVMRGLSQITLFTTIWFLVGTALAWWITSVSPSETPNDYWFIFLSGAIAICAMILPGISGSFVMLLLGKYIYMMNAIKEMNVMVMAIFMCGAAIGIVSFSHLLHYILKRYHVATVAVLGGFMVGSLNKVWPWKKITSTFIDENEIVRPLTEINITPSAYETITGQESMMIYAILSALIGLSLVFAVEYVAKSMKKGVGEKPLN